jgi:hypothetical protein
MGPLLVPSCPSFNPPTTLNSLSFRPCIRCRDPSTKGEAANQPVDATRQAEISIMMRQLETCIGGRVYQHTYTLPSLSSQFSISPSSPPAIVPDIVYLKARSLRPRMCKELLGILGGREGALLAV